VPDLAPAYGSDAGREVIWEGAADGAAGLIEEIRENSMASTCFCCRRATMAPAVLVLPASSTRRQA